MQTEHCAASRVGCGYPSLLRENRLQCRVRAARASSVTATGSRESCEAGAEHHAGSADCGCDAREAAPQGVVCGGLSCGACARPPAAPPARAVADALSHERSGRRPTMSRRAPPAHMDEATGKDMQQWTPGVAGDLTRAEFEQALAEAGLNHIEARETHRVDRTWPRRATAAPGGRPEAVTQAQRLHRGPRRRIALVGPVVGYVLRRRVERGRG
jgi:hypothetical protein